MPREIDTLIRNAHLFTLQGDGVGYQPAGAVAIEGQVIIETGPTAELDARYAARQVVDAAGQAVLPGLIDAHMHTRYAIVRGVAQDVGHWMQLGLAPFAKHVDDEAALAGTRLNVLEALQAGTTTMGDFLRPYPGWAETFAEAGVRACLTPQINALPKAGMAGWKVGDIYPLDEAAGKAAIDAALAFCDRWEGENEGRIQAFLGPQGPDMLSREQLLAVKSLAERRDLKLHVHVAQGDREIDQMLLRYGKRTPAFLDEIGYLDERLLAVHLTEATDEETDLIAHRGAGMILCSGSIGIIDGIVPPAARFRAAGGRVALGSDQASGNNCNNIFNEMKLTALFNKIQYRDPTVMPAWEALRLATIEGAQVLGLDDRIGSLEAGKQADLILVDLNQPNLLPALESPVRTIVPNLVYAGTGKEVASVMVAGQFLMRDREMLTLDPAAICAEAQRHAERVALAVSQDPLVEDLSLAKATAAGLM